VDNSLGVRWPEQESKDLSSYNAEISNSAGTYPHGAHKKNFTYLCLIEMEVSTKLKDMYTQE
jgi:hypothetical protein